MKMVKIALVAGLIATLGGCASNQGMADLSATSSRFAVAAKGWSDNGTTTEIRQNRGSRFSNSKKVQMAYALMKENTFQAAYASCIAGREELKGSSRTEAIAYCNKQL